MELVKAIIALITSFFNNSTQAKKEDIKLADAVEEVTIEKIRATENAVAIEQTKKTQEALETLKTKQQEENIDAEQDPKAIDDQFGSSY
jgi:hypothetical protein